MNNLRNSVRLIGNLGTNPEVKVFEKGSKVARLTLATNESYKDNEGKLVKETSWHTLVAWNAKAEFVEKYFAKGNEVAVEGRLTTRNYTDKAGIKHYLTEIVINDIMSFGKKNSDNS